MLTYLNENCKRVPIEDKEKEALWYEIDKALCALDDDTFDEYNEIIDAYVWDKSKANANKLRAIAKKIGFTMYELAMWYCVEEW